MACRHGPQECAWREPDYQIRSDSLRKGCASWCPAGADKTQERSGSRAHPASPCDHLVRCWGPKDFELSVPNTGQDGRKDLPGEHGFRFFPAFYRHRPVTMKRIPYAGNLTVFENLVQASRILVFGAGKPSLILNARSPQNVEDWALTFKDTFRGIGVPDDEVLYFVDRLFTLLTSCSERRIAEYEQIPWWTFINAANHSADYQTLLGKGLTRSLVAVRAQDGSTRTVGYTLLQLLFGLLTYGGFDRLLTGPTSDVWLTPWSSYLQQRGVRFETGTTIKSLNLSSVGITSVTAETGGQSQQITADYYISAMPVEIMATLVDDQLKTYAPSLANLNCADSICSRGFGGVCPALV